MGVDEYPGGHAFGKRTILLELGFKTFSLKFKFGPDARQASIPAPLPLYTFRGKNEIDRKS